MNDKSNDTVAFAARFSTNARLSEGETRKEMRGMTANNPLTPVRKLTPQEVADLTALAIPAHLATFDPTGFPRVIPLWFLWEDEIFYMSSGSKSRHVQDLVRDSRAGLCITVEEDQT